MHLQYAAIAPDGTLLGVSETPQDATRLAKAATPDHGIVVEAIPEERQENPAGPRHESLTTPRKALAKTGLEPVSREDVLDIPEKEAWERSLQFFGGLGGSWQKKAQAIKGFRGTNEKLKKAGKLGMGVNTGLALVPYNTPADPAAIGIEGTKKGLMVGLQDMLQWLPEGWEPGRHHRTLCAGSTEGCRTACLTHSGQYAQDSSRIPRLARTLFLLNDPLAFARMLVATLEQLERTSKGKNYFRLNVLSDVPWEEFFEDAWLFDEFPGIQFYDYTKVPNRVTPVNYDLTFSFSGHNFLQMERELARGGKATVVFLAYTQEGGKDPRWKTWHQGQVTPEMRRGPAKALLKGKTISRLRVPLPEEAWGYPVIDGDVNDLRPLDPHFDTGLVVGLRWKTPFGQGIDYTSEKLSFVTPVYHTSSEMLVERATGPLGPGGLPRRKNPDDGILIAPQTPRFIDENY